MPIFIFCFGILFSKMPFENLMLFFVYPNKCQTLWYETILHNKQNNKKYLSPPFFSQYLHYRPQFGCYQSKKDEVLPPQKNYRIFVREDRSFVKRCSSINRKKKMENRERNKSCNSIWLEAKACFWSLLKIFLFVLAPPALTLQCGSEKKKVLSPTDDSKFHWLSF